jgi:hypothetical protein
MKLIQFKIQKPIKSNLTCVFLMTLFILCTSGIYRPDVPLSAYLELAKQKQFDCVAQLYIDSQAHGSCVLIGDRFVLTAAHVLFKSESVADTVEMNGHTVVVFTPSNIRVVDSSKINIRINGRRIKVKRFVIHPQYLKKMGEGNCDLALIELTSSIDSVQTALLYKGKNELSSDVVGVGFGVSGKADRPDSIFPLGLKIAGENVIDKVSGYAFNGKKCILSADFDALDVKECNQMGSAIPRPLEYICSGGDSGGGLFKQEDGVWYLIGICSGSQMDVNKLMQTGYFCQVMDWTRVSPFSEWISSSIHTMEANK